MPAPLVSVIIPAYDAQDTLERCVTSVLTQTEPSIEAIIVDDGSTDGTPDLIARLASSDDRIVTVQQPNGGLGAARNTGVQHAQGTWLAFVDSDDWIEPNMLAALVSAAEAAQADVANCETFLDALDAQDSTVSSSVLRLPLGGKMVPGFQAFAAFSVLIPPVMNSVCFKLFRRSSFASWDASFPEGYRFAEDMPVSARAFLRSPRVALVHEPLYHYIRSSSVITTSFSLKKADDLLADMDEICADAREAGYEGSLDAFKLEMLFSATRQTIWSGEASTAAGKELLKRIAAERPAGKPDTAGLAIPLMQRVKMGSVAHGCAPLLCRIAYALRWLPAVKNMM